jgi:hypothetical protein
MHEHSMNEAAEIADYERVFAALHEHNEVTVALKMKENAGRQILRLRTAIRQGMKVYFGTDCETPSIVRNHDDGFLLIQFVKKPAEVTEAASAEFNGIIPQLLKNSDAPPEYHKLLTRMLLATFQYRGELALFSERIEKMLEGETKERAERGSILYYALFKQPENHRLITMIQEQLSKY